MTVGTQDDVRIWKCPGCGHVIKMYKHLKTTKKIYKLKCPECRNFWMESNDELGWIGDLKWAEDPLP